MTREEAVALGKRLQVCRLFRPMAGMIDLEGRTWGHSLLSWWHRDVDNFDVREPSTKGCLRALVLEAYYDEGALWDGYVEVQRDHKGLFFVTRPFHNEDGALCHQHIATGNTEEEALVAALEVASG